MGRPTRAERIRRAAAFLWIKARSRFHRRYRIGAHVIVLPPGHALDKFRAHHPGYERPIEVISGLVAEKYEGLTAIDVGANVGDTAAFMVKDARCRVLCIEGNARFSSLLQQNVRSFCPDAEFELAFIGDCESGAAPVVETGAGTSRIVLGGDTGDAVKLVSLDDVLARRAAFKDAHFLKIDTDGFDPDVLRSGANFISRRRPVIFFEMDPCQPSSPYAKCVEAIEQLLAAGYDTFHVFDNAGTHLMRLTREQSPLLRQLLDYIVLNSRLKKRAVYYYDVCALSGEDRDISDKIVELCAPGTS
ncbi:FkbM family methyltransferase [Rhodoblastus acidophilus]|uniref:FkbM family methyltransferase n=1 Tax=Rhodoblastus acidophilus TaxID=1074 RepID=A0A6N8DMC8_RHOAC|nr:FkbM family methyltransferase [Rhodoblastus acidophilus]MCW2275366.1 FkbM family methyltransferase [Rhodoblastus acidophilus]MTV31742.1 FkbM family methyltransferase [Rhodoblastus acidophilus]